MGFLCIGDSSFSQLCAEDSDNILGCDEDEGEAHELGKNLNFSGFVGLQLESDELVEYLMVKEKEQLIETASRDYLERLNNGGLELSWRIEAIDWICKLLLIRLCGLQHAAFYFYNMITAKVRAHYNFGPLCVYLAVNYLDRFLSSKQLLLDDTPWMQQLLAVACLCLAAKMDETEVPQSLDIQVYDAKYVFEAKTIKRMEILVLSTLKWRMHSVTPFSYIDYFLDKFNEGKLLTNDLVSRCIDLILGTLKATMFLQFRPSEIAAAVALSVVAEAQVVDFGCALVASKIPIDKENVGRCHEAMQEMVLVNKNAHTSTSPSGVLDTSCSFRSDDNITPGSSLTNKINNDNNHQACTPASKRIRLDPASMS